MPSRVALFKVGFMKTPACVCLAELTANSCASSEATTSTKQCAR